MDGDIDRPDLVLGAAHDLLEARGVGDIDCVGDQLVPPPRHLLPGERERLRRAGEPDDRAATGGQFPRDEEPEAAGRARDEGHGARGEGAGTGEEGGDRGARHVWVVPVSVRGYTAGAQVCLPA